MSIVGFRCKRGYRTVDECLDCTQRCILITPVKEEKAKISSGYYANRPNEYHVTSLVGCPRKATLGLICGEYIPPINLWKMQLGTLCHSMMEKYPMFKGRTERRLNYRYYIEREGKKHRCMVVGRYDLFSDKILHDYKFPWSISYIPDTKHFRQMATYYIIGRKAGMFEEGDVAGCQVDYVDITTAKHYPFRCDGEAWKKYADEMQKEIPVMLLNFVNAVQFDTLPQGRLDMDQCNYCPPEFKEFCPQLTSNVNALSNHNSCNVIKASVDAFRKTNTPTEENED